MSSVPSSVDSCPARRSCLYMSRISARCFCSRSRRAWKRSRGTSAATLATLAFSVLATLLLLSTGALKKVTDDTALQGLAMIAHSGLNGERTEELLIKHDACQLVGEGQGTEGEDAAGRFQHGAVQPEVGADQ